MKKNNFINLLLGLMGCSLAFASGGDLKIVNNSNTQLYAYCDNNPVCSRTYVDSNKSQNVDLGGGDKTLTSDMDIFSSTTGKSICHIQAGFFDDHMPFDQTVNFPPTYFNVLSNAYSTPGNMIRLYGPYRKTDSNAVILLSGDGFMNPFPDQRSVTPALKCSLTYAHAGDITQNLGGDTFHVDMTVTVTNYDPNNKNVFVDYPQ